MFCDVINILLYQMTKLNGQNDKNLNWQQSSEVEILLSFFICCKVKLHVYQVTKPDNLSMNIVDTKWQQCCLLNIWIWQITIFSAQNVKNKNFFENNHVKFKISLSFLKVSKWYKEFPLKLKLRVYDVTT